MSLACPILASDKQWDGVDGRNKSPLPSSQGPSTRWGMRERTQKALMDKQKRVHRPEIVKKLTWDPNSRHSSARGQDAERL